MDVEYINEDDDTQPFNGIPVLTCDTITQTKEKIIKFIYKVTISMKQFPIKITDFSFYNFGLLWKSFSDKILAFFFPTIYFCPT